MLHQTFKHFIVENDKIQQLAKLLNVTSKELDEIGEDSVEDIISNIGNHDFVPDSEFDTTQLKLGISVELEHTKSKLIAKLIAKDHLTEDPKYYIKLKKMESGD